MKQRWNDKAVIFLLLCIIVTCFFTKNVQAQEPQTITVPVALDLTKATGIDINLRLNPELVETAEISNKEDSLAEAIVMEKQTVDKLKVGIASSKEINNKGTLFSLKLTLKKAVTEEDELVKVLQVRVNEKTVYKAENTILVNGVADGKTYHNAVSIGFNEGTAMLNGTLYEKNSMVSQEGNHVLEITDLNGNKRTISFTITYPKPKASYKVEFYLQNAARNGYVRQEKDTVTKSAIVGTMVTADNKQYPGFTRNKQVSGKVSADGSLLLKVYYTRNTYKISYMLNGGVNNKGNAASFVYGTAKTLYAPSRNGYVFQGWYANSKFTGTAVSKVAATVTSNVTVYAKWQAVSISFAKSEVTLQAGKTYKNTVKIAPATKTVTYATSNKKIATVDKNGLVKGIAPGNATISVTAHGVKKSYMVFVAPNPTKITKVKKASNNATITWNKINGATGYEVYYSADNKKFSKEKDTNSKTVSYKKAGLKKGKTYYFKVRTYKTIGSKKIYSGYSSSYKVKL